MDGDEACGMNGRQASPGGVERVSETIEKLGKLIGPDDKRDAVHIAVAPVIAAMRLIPGMHVGLVEGSTEQITAVAEAMLGIVDPYLTAAVEKGERCWLFLYPRTIESLRHEWTHPAFPLPVVMAKPKPSREESERWLRDYIKHADCPGYEAVMAAAVGDHEKNRRDDDDEDYCYSSNDGEYLHFGGRDAHGTIPREFWDHVENVTGKTIPDEMRARWFSCSC